MSAVGISRFALLAISCLLAVTAGFILIAAIFSVSFRSLNAFTLAGIKHYGLFRYCWESTQPINQQQSGITDERWTCFFRPMDENSNAVMNIPYNGYGNAVSGADTNEVVQAFEKTTLILLTCSAVLILMSLCFALCTIFSELCAVAHSAALLASAVAGLAGFLVYMFNGEQRGNLDVVDKGIRLFYHYGWAYYWTAIACAILIVAFLISIFATSMFFYNKRNKRHHSSSVQRTTVKL